MTMNPSFPVCGETITDTVQSAFEHLLNMEKPHAVLNIESHVFNVTLESMSCKYKLDIGKQLWLNRQRWSRLIKEYVPRDNLLLFISQAQEILSGNARDGATANMMFRDPIRYEKKHRWGGCLMGAVFRGNGKRAGPPSLTLYSRTTYIGYMGFMDAGIAALIAEAIDPQIQIQFRWYIASMQCHCFKSLPYVYSNPRLMKVLEMDARRVRNGRRKPIPPTRRNMAKWYNKVLEAWNTHGMDMLEHEKYGPFKRIKRRWMEHMGHSSKNVPPSVSIMDLDFSKAI